LDKKGRFAKVSEICAVMERSLSIDIQMRLPCTQWAGPEREGYFFLDSKRKNGKMKRKREQRRS
jgi:hypothetical protein